jgi:hypothetical protein
MRINIEFDETFISVFIIDEEVFYLEHNEKLSDDKIIKIYTQFN